jgi:perosamine synthetase
MTEMRIPLSAPDIGQAEIDAVLQVLRSSRLSLGPKLAEFEEAIRAYTGAHHAIAVSSGTSGLHCCLRALGLQEGDEVIVPSFTFIAAANVIRYERAVPVFVDIDPASLNMDPQSVREAVTPRTRAILVVHTFGRPAELDPICEIAREQGLTVIEDACEAIGAEYQGRKVGRFGATGVFAFYPNKQITTGEGGMIVTDDPDLARTVRALRNQGRFDSQEWFQHEILGFSYRISEMDCALGVEQMRRIDEILARRAAIAHSYAEKLRHAPELVLPASEVTNGRMSWFVYVLRLGAYFNEQDRDHVLEEMEARGIACGRYFAPVHQQPAYAYLPLRHALPVTESESQRAIALPFFNSITDDQIAEVSETLLQLARRCG